jgi:hypothetical protein
MADRTRSVVTVEEYVERRTEGPSGRTIERRYRRTRWEAVPPAGRPAALQVAEIAGPLLRAVAIALAPAAGRLAVRLLAPRVRAALLPSRRALPRARPSLPLLPPHGWPGPSEEAAGPK